MEDIAGNAGRLARVAQGVGNGATADQIQAGLEWMGRQAAAGNVPVGYADLTRARAAVVVPAGRDEAGAIAATVQLFQGAAGRAFRTAFGIGAGGMDASARQRVANVAYMINTTGGRRVPAATALIAQRLTNGDMANLELPNATDILLRSVTGRARVQSLTVQHMQAAGISNDNMRDYIVALAGRYQALGGNMAALNQALVAAGLPQAGIAPALQGGQRRGGGQPQVQQGGIHLGTAQAQNDFFD
ncbi:MAG: hypothetical protein LBU35_00900 [Holosporales bacterium]|nr:hypothetical protein [Holosporales bacterium]